MTTEKRPRWNINLVPGILDSTSSSSSSSTLPPVSSEGGTKKQRTRKRETNPNLQLMPIQGPRQWEILPIDLEPVTPVEPLPSTISIPPPKSLNLGLVDDPATQSTEPLTFSYHRPTASLTLLSDAAGPKIPSSLQHLSLSVDRQVPSLSMLGVGQPPPMDNLSFKVERPTPVISLSGGIPSSPRPVDDLSFKVERPVPHISLLGNIERATTASIPSFDLDVAGKTAQFTLFNTFGLSNIPKVPMLRLALTHVDSRLNTAIAAMHALLAKKEIEDFDKRTEAALKELDVRISKETSVEVREQLRANANRLQDLRRTKKDEIEESNRKIKETLASIEEGSRTLDKEPDDSDIPILDPNDRHRLEESLLRSIDLIHKLHGDIIKDQNDYLGLIERSAVAPQTITVAKEKLEHLREKRAEKARERATAAAEAEKLHTQLEQLQHTIVHYQTSEEEKREHDEKQAQLADLNRRKRTLAKEIRDLSHQMDESLRLISHNACLSAHDAESFVQTFSNLVSLVDVSHLPPLSGVSQKIQKLRHLLQRFEHKKLLYRHLNLVHSFGQDIAKLEELKREHDIKFKGKTIEEILKLRESGKGNLEEEEEVIRKIDKLKWQFEKLNSSARNCHINRYLRRFKEFGMFNLILTKKKKDVSKK